jgi:hypothetical protein
MDQIGFFMRGPAELEVAVIVVDTAASDANRPSLKKLMPAVDGQLHVLEFDNGKGFDLERPGSDCWSTAVRPGRPQGVSARVSAPGPRRRRSTGPGPTRCRRSGG